MEKVELSGGDFGGPVVEVEQSEASIKLTNEAGTWVYDRDRHVDGGRSQAHLVEFKAR